MPVTTRAAALRSQTDGHTVSSNDQLISTSAVASDTVRKHPSRQKRKQVEVQPAGASDQPEIFPKPQQQFQMLNLHLTLSMKLFSANALTHK